MSSKIKMKFKNRAQIYAFTTENIGGYFPKLDLKNKRVLTVSSSGDHVINSFFFGANSVVCFDINNYANFFTELKLVAMKKLSYILFKDFFLRAKEGQKNNKALNFEVYKNLRKYLSKKSKTFFDACYSEFNFSGSAFRESNYFNNKYDTNKLKIFSNPYLKDKYYYNKASKNIKSNKITYVHSSIINLKKKISGKFDIILLSNIADYAKEIYPNRLDYLSRFFNRTIMPFMKNLKSRGVICIAYIYDLHSKPPFRSDIDNPKKRKEIFYPKKIYKEVIVNSVINKKKDLIIIQKNGRK